MRRRSDSDGASGDPDAFPARTAPPANSEAPDELPFCFGTLAILDDYVLIPVRRPSPRGSTKR